MRCDRFGWRTFGVTARWCGFAIVLALFGARAHGAETSRPVLYLHTEFLPYKQLAENDLPYRLGREMVRQAFLMAARDEMGLPTRDGTLHETATDGAETVHLLLNERANLNGKWQLKLIAYKDGMDIQAAPPLWEKTYEYNASGTKMYADMVPKLVADVSGNFLVALRASGLSGERPPLREPQAPPDELEQLLHVPDFVAQYAAVRTAHRAIAERGETAEWLGILVRGYAHLALLTQHQWNAASEAFAARSWLYAQRMVVATSESDAALWHRAYAWAFTGAIHHALSDLELLAERENGTNENATDSTPDWPAWDELVEAYCSCDRAAVKQVGEAHADLKPWATYLWFQLSSAARYSTWMYHAGREVAEVCPTAYGVYAELAHHGRTLGATRMGAAFAPSALGHFLPQSLEAMADLPDAIREVLPLNAERREKLATLIEDPEPRDSFTVTPTYVARELREQTRQQLETDLSWSLLAYLIEEEQFVGAANMLHVSLNATESSLAGEVDALLPLVKGHRYEAFIESFRFNRRRDADQLQELMSELEIVDPRRNMTPLFSRAWGVTNRAGHRIGSVAYAAAHRNFTLPAMIEYLFASGSTWSAPEEDYYRNMLSRELCIIAPGLEVGTRLSIQAAKEPTIAELQAWEEQLHEDPTAYTYLADHYKRLGQREDAVRCYEKSLASLPTWEAASRLSDHYMEQKEYEPWEKTLLEFLKSEDLGLQHAQAHQRLAFGFMNRGQWRTAKPHAVAAGQTWSAWGLSVASYICEGLAEWNESEQWIREMSRNYPSSAGDEWYFWCVRTGRGDKEAARRLAQEFFAIPIQQPTRENQVTLGAFHLMEGNRERALEAYRHALSFRPTFTCTFMVARLSREMGDEQGRAKVLEAMERSLLEKPADADPMQRAADVAGLAILTLIKSGDASDERLAEIEKLLGPVQSNTRSAFSYFLATELALLDKQEEAEKYWRRALIIPARDPIYATLAGKELADRHGTSRPDDDELREASLWPQPEPAAEAAEN